MIAGKENWEEWDKWINGSKTEDVALTGRVQLALLRLPQNFLRFWMGCFYSEYEDSAGKPKLEAIVPPDHEYQFIDPNTGQTFYATKRKETPTSLLLPGLYKWWDDVYPPTPDMVSCSVFGLPENGGKPPIQALNLAWSDMASPYLERFEVGAASPPIVLSCPMGGLTTVLEQDSLAELDRSVAALIKYQRSLIPRSLYHYIRLAEEGSLEETRGRAADMRLAGVPFSDILHRLYLSDDVQLQLEMTIRRYGTTYEKSRAEKAFRKCFRDRIYKYLKDAGLRPDRAKGNWWILET